MILYDEILKYYIIVGNLKTLTHTNRDVARRRDNNNIYE